VETIRSLASYAVLLPLGVSLCFFGIIMRSFARSSQRAQALRKQHRLHDRKLGEASQPDPAAGWFERHLPFIANATAIAGLVLTLLAFARK